MCHLITLRFKACGHSEAGEGKACEEPRGKACHTFRKDYMDGNCTQCSIKLADFEELLWHLRDDSKRRNNKALTSKEHHEDHEEHDDNGMLAIPSNNIIRRLKAEAAEIYDQNALSWKKAYLNRKHIFSSMNWNKTTKFPFDITKSCVKHYINWHTSGMHKVLVLALEIAIRQGEEDLVGEIKTYLDEEITERGSEVLDVMDNLGKCLEADYEGEEEGLNF